MRMIDFRAWDKKKSEILDVMDIDFSGNKVGVCNVPKRLFKDGRLHTIHSIERDWSEVELMQYTGLKDKNGVEIYEGDILKDEQTERLWKISFRNHAHGLYFESYYPTFDNAFTRDFNSNKWAGNYWEVIGNIYENPELLEEI